MTFKEDLYKMVTIEELRTEIAHQAKIVARLQEESDELYNSWMNGNGGACAYNDYHAAQPFLEQQLEYLNELERELADFHDGAKDEEEFGVCPECGRNIGLDEVHHGCF